MGCQSRCRRRHHATLLGLLLACAALAGERDLGPSDMLVYPASASARVLTSFAGQTTARACSGSMIDAFHALTAGSCVFDEDLGQATSVVVIPGATLPSSPRRWLEPFGRATSVDFLTFQPWTEDADTDWDLAVVRLDQPVGARTGWYVYSFAPDEDLEQAELSVFRVVGTNQELTFVPTEVNDDSLVTDEVFNDEHNGATANLSLGATTEAAYAVFSHDAQNLRDEVFTRITTGKYVAIRDYIDQVTPTQPDLLAIDTGIRYFLQPVTLWDEIEGLWYSVLNYSTASWSGTLNVNLYLSTDDVVDTGDLPVFQDSFTTTISAREVLRRELPPGSAFVPDGVCGEDYQLLAELTVADLDPANNVSRYPYQLRTNPCATIRGTVADAAGDALEGVEIAGIVDPPPVTDAAGAFEVVVPGTWVATATPSRTGYHFDPPAATVVAGGQYEFTGHLNTYTIAGYVREAGTMAPLEGVLMSGFPGGPVTTDATGLYVGTVDYGTTLEVRPLADGYNMDPPASEHVFVNSVVTQYYTAIPGWAAASGWPRHQADARHSGYRAAVSVRDVERWRAEVPGVPTSPVVGVWGEVYVGTSEGEVYALDRDGEPVWSVDLQAPIDHPPALGSAGRVYVVSADGTLWTLDHAGEVVWSWSSGSAGGTAPLVADVGADGDGRVYFGGAGLHAVDVDGTQLWSHPTAGAVTASPARDPAGVVYAGDDGGNLYAVDETGQQLWVYPAGGAISSAPTVASDGAIYFGADDGLLYALEPAGTLRWTFVTGGPVRSSPALDVDGNIHFGSDDGNVYAVDPAGVELWRYGAGAPVASSPAINRYAYTAAGIDRVEELLYVGTRDGYVVSLTLDSPNRPQAPGARRWSFATGTEAASSPALGEAGLYVASAGGRVHALGPHFRGTLRVTGLLHDEGLLTREDLDLIFRLEALGGGLEMIDPLDDPCAGGPVAAVGCDGDPVAGFGATSPWIEIFAGGELVVDVASGGDVEASLAGEGGDRVLGRSSLTLEGGGTQAAVLAGVTNPEAFARNPDGRDTGLRFFVVPGLEAAFERRDLASVWVGHFVTDAGAMALTLSGEVDREFGPLRYGEHSELVALPPGRYEAELSLPGEGVARTWRIDLRDSAGKPVGLMLGGFLEPAANRGGPALDLHAQADGQVLAAHRGSGLQVALALVVVLAALLLTRLALRRGPGSD